MNNAPRTMPSGPHDDIKPPLALYVVWHPKYATGGDIGKLLCHHFGTDLYRNVTGKSGIPVLFRNFNASNMDGPLPVDLNSAHVTAVVVLLDRELVRDDMWVQYIRNLVDMAEKEPRILVFPVIMEPDAMSAHLSIHAIRLDTWEKVPEEQKNRLVREIVHGLITMFMNRLEPSNGARSLATTEEEIRQVKIFLSHSHHDGLAIAKEIRDWLYKNTALNSFFAPVDITPGMLFHNVIDQNIRNSAMLIIYTDTYSSRNWCGYEVVKAKRESIPIVMIDCLNESDDRSFPYLGNVPVLRLDPHRLMISKAIGLLLDEILRSILWQHAVKNLYNQPPATFTARPPELLSLVTLPSTGSDKTRLIVYPDPPLSEHELELFADVDSSLKMLSLRQWQMEVGA